MFALRSLTIWASVLWGDMSSYVEDILSERTKLDRR
jgi:hypothetical protein